MPDTETTIRPALTPEEWAIALAGRPMIHPDKRHAAAALWLYGQPFGFTQEDLDDLRAVCDAYEWDTIHGKAAARQDRLPGILAKIAALLPPT